MFDIFGTVVDWWGTIVEEGGLLSSTIDWSVLAYDWLVGYRARVEAVRKGQRSWANLDTLLDEAFTELAAKYDFAHIDPKALSDFRGVWHRLKPWPDVAGGLARLAPRYVLGALSNGSMLLLIDMAKHSRLPWDCVLSAELVRKYKPENDLYRLALDTLGPGAGRVLYVAAHKWDLQAGQATGLLAAYLPRPLQLGPGGPPPEPPDPNFDLVVSTVNELADQLGA